ncbi:MAG: ribosome small subunit-dependent GTPase A [Acidobacteriota bacterium]
MTVLGLTELGWSDRRAAEFAPFAALGLVPGRVSLEHNHVYRVITGEGERLGEAAGRMKHEAGGRHELPVVGDWTAIRLDPSGGRSQIRGLLPRRSWVSRKVAGRETVEQVVAANIDTAFVVFGLDKPVNARSIERYLVVARGNGVTPVVVLNKSDLAKDPAAAIAEAMAVAGDVSVLCVSSQTGVGLDGLDRYLETGRTVALFGPSGVGKSSIVNRLVKREVLATGEVRDWDQRGRHTSVHRQLVVREAGGLIIDTPGMRELQLWDTDPTNDTFADVVALGEACRFRNCSHDREPGCAVKAAIAAGTLDADRHVSFLKLQAEQRELNRKRDERAQAPSARSTRVAHRAYRSLKTNRGGKTNGDDT